MGRDFVDTVFRTAGGGGGWEEAKNWTGKLTILCFFRLGNNTLYDVKKLFASRHDVCRLLYEVFLQQWLSPARLACANLSYPLDLPFVCVSRDSTLPLDKGNLWSHMYMTHRVLL